MGSYQPRNSRHSLPLSTIILEYNCYRIFSSSMLYFLHVHIHPLFSPFLSLQIETITLPNVTEDSMEKNGIIVGFVVCFLCGVLFGLSLLRWFLIFKTLWENVFEKKSLKMKLKTMPFEKYSQIE